VIIPRFRIRTLMIAVAVVAAALTIPWSEIGNPLALAAAIAVVGVILSLLLSACFVLLDRILSAFRTRD